MSERDSERPVDIARIKRARQVRARSIIVEKRRRPARLRSSCPSRARASGRRCTASSRSSKDGRNTIRGMHLLRARARRPGLGGEISNPLWRGEVAGQAGPHRRRSAQRSTSTVIKGAASTGPDKCPRGGRALAGATLTARTASTNLDALLARRTGLRPLPGEAARRRLVLDG